MAFLIFSLYKTGEFIANIQYYQNTSREKPGYKLSVFL